MTDNDRFIGYSFPVVRVRYCGPTNTKGSRFVATVLQRLDAPRVTHNWDHSISAPKNAHVAARKAWNATVHYGDESERVLIPGDYSSSDYVFLVVPAAMLADKS